MVKVLSQAFGGGKDNSNAVKVNDMSADRAVSELNNFFGGW